MQQAGDELMTIPDVARELSVSVDTVYRWRVYGNGPPGIKVNGAVRFRRSDFDRWLAAHRERRKAAVP